MLTSELGLRKAVGGGAECEPWGVRFFGELTLPQEDRPLAALTKQRQTSIGDAVREWGPRSMRLGFWKGRDTEFVQRWRGLGVASLQWNGCYGTRARVPAALHACQTGLSGNPSPPNLCYPSLRSFFP